jgi:bacterioferritin
MQRFHTLLIYQTTKGGPIVTQEKLLLELNRALQNEYRSVFQYLQNSYMVKGMRRPSIVGWLRSQAQRELQDAIKLADKIVSLGGVPTTELPEITHATRSEQILRESLLLERSAVDIYRGCIKLANQQDDTSLRLLLEELLAEAEQDVEEIQKMVVEE